MKNPRFILINNEKIPIDTNFKTALKCFDIINDETIGDRERACAVIYKLFKRIPEDYLLPVYLEKAEKYLSCGSTQKEHKERVRDIDFTQDWKFLVSSFMSDYQININEADLHFWDFIALVEGVTEDTSISRVRSIRNRDLSEIKDEKTRKAIAKMQQELALEVVLTKEEKELDDEFEALLDDE